MSQESQTPRIHIKRRVELFSLQNEPSSTHNELESSEISKKKELESTIPETVDELKTAQKLNKGLKDKNK
ncbi:hypothetical protein Glove_78g82 [Diversispora epigaea]|uniref:Uncharacterized protein n=1 Tax=Diversispora epigaea TaxID=1348612 RepID=A0A397JJE6_9GLOM|nr:hypothetical protein Glove_78g82 [Diversispora epigaea]